MSCSPRSSHDRLRLGRLPPELGTVVLAIVVVPDVSSVHRVSECDKHRFVLYACQHVLEFNGESPPVDCPAYERRHPLASDFRHGLPVVKGESDRESLLERHITEQSRSFKALAVRRDFERFEAYIPAAQFQELVVCKVRQDEGDLRRDGGRHGREGEGSFAVVFSLGLDGRSVP